MKEARRYTFVINESGLYALVLASQLPAAQEFKHWVTSEVLPAIRENGSYFLFNDDDTPFNKRFSIHARNAEARDFKAFKQAQRDTPPAIEPPTVVETPVIEQPIQPVALLAPLDLAEKLIAIADRLNGDEVHDKILLHAANLFYGKNIF